MRAGQLEMLPFAMSDEAVLTVSQLKKLLPFEKKVAVRRVEQYLQGNMPLFNKKVESNGLVSAAYLMLAYYWGLFWGTALIAASLLALVENNSASLLIVRSALYLVAVVTLSISLRRFFQGRRVAARQ